MLQLDELQFQYIGRFIEVQTIKVSSLGSFIQFDGNNLNTGGSSGSGKSTVFQALDYLFGLNERPATVMQSRKIINPEEKPIWVKGIFSLGDDIITIVRSKSLVEITIGGETFKKTKAEEKIEALMGMPGDLFRKIIHKRQDEGGFFLNLSPSEMNNFLMDCIGLSSFKVKCEKIEARLGELEKFIEIENQNLEKLKALLSSSQDAILALGLAPVQEIHREVILELKEKLDRSAIRFNDVKNGCEAMVEEYVRKRPNTTVLQYDETTREDLERRRKEIEVGISACLQKERDRQEAVRHKIGEHNIRRIQIINRIKQGERAKDDAAKIASEINSIRESTCPTCSQEWKTESAVASERSKLAEIAALKIFIDDANQATADLFYLDQLIKDVQKRLTPQTDVALINLNDELSQITEKILQEKKRAGELYEQQSVEMRAKLDAFGAGREALQRKCDMELDQARGQMDLDRRVLDAALQKLKSYEAAKKTYDDSYNKLKKNEEIFSKQIADCTFLLESALKERILASESKKAIKMYISFSFDEALEAISDKATKIIRCIPNVSNATIQLESTKETQKGVVKEEVNAVLSSDGETGVPIKSLSGGERSSTDLAVDLSVIDYIEKKTGKGLNVFILDEPFKGLGAVEIEGVLEVLKNSNTNKKLVIVDHNAEVKEMVQNRLIVTRSGLTSRVA